MKRNILIISFIVMSFVGAISVFAAELTAELELRRVSIGHPVYLNIIFQGSHNVARPDIEEVDGLKIKYIGPSSQISVVNGRTSQSVTHSYLVIPGSEGNFTIGPFSVKFGGKIYSASPVTLIVDGAPDPSRAQSQAPSGGQYSPVRGQQTGSIPKKSYFGDKIFLVMEVPRKEVYINEKVPLVVKLYVKQVGLKDIEYPKFDHDGFSADKWVEPEKKQGFYRGEEYNILIFRRDLFGIKEGRYVLGPASLGAKAVVPQTARRRRSTFGRSVFNDDFFSDMFGRTETYPMDMESDPLTMTVLPFPDEGKPGDFAGAIGDFRMETHVDSLKVNTGDPITLKIIISGTGNLDTVMAPSLRSAEGYKVYEPQVTKKDNSKIYEQIIIPKSDEVSEIPPISFSFFNPKTREYETLREDPVPVEVSSNPDEGKGVKIVSMDTAEKMFYPTEKLGQDIIHIKPDLGILREKGTYLYTIPLFWTFQALPIALFLSIYSVKRKREKIRSDTSYARFLKAPGTAKNGIKKAQSYLRKNDALKFCDTVYKTLQEYLSRKLDLPIGVISVAEVDAKLKDTSHGAEILSLLEEIFAICDMARYASSSIDKERSKEIFNKFRKVIDLLQRTRV